MKWFKHDSDATTDARIKKLIFKYGPEGYAVYFHCIELIVGDMSESNITFELEHDAEIIADNLKIKGTAEYSGIDRVNDIMKYIVNLGLFSEDNGHVRCYKLAKRLDTSMTSNSKFRAMIDSVKNHDSVMTQSCKTRQDYTKQEEIRREQESIPTDKSVSLTHKQTKHKHGEYQNVLLTDEELTKLKAMPDGERAIEWLSEHIEMKGYKAKSHYLAIRKWVFVAMAEHDQKAQKVGVKVASTVETAQQKANREFDEEMRRRMGIGRE